MKRLMLSALLMLSMAGLTGCYKDMIVVDKGYNPAKAVPDFESGRLYIFGFGIGEPVSLNQVCPSGAGIIQVKTLFFVSIFGYSKDIVYCKGA
jgi:hypothetical protein